MNDRRRRRLLGSLAVLAVAVPAGRALAQIGLPHGDHNPHHGGVVLMYGMDLHFEILLRANGAIKIYFSDGQRMDLPASAAADLALEIERSNGKTAAVAMLISRTGEYWEGLAGPIEASATLHLAFVFQGDSVILTLPAASLLRQA